jgi:hypothetical protein
VVRRASLHEHDARRCRDGVVEAVRWLGGELRWDKERQSMETTTARAWLGACVPPE